MNHKVEAAFDVLKCDDATQGAPRFPSEFTEVSGRGDQRSGAVETSMGTSCADPMSFQYIYIYLKHQYDIELFNIILIYVISRYTWRLGSMISVPTFAGKPFVLPEL